MVNIELVRHDGGKHLDWLSAGGLASESLPVPDFFADDIVHQECILTLCHWRLVNGRHSSLAEISLWTKPLLRRTPSDWVGLARADSLDMGELSRVRSDPMQLTR